MPAGGNPIETGSNEERIAQLESLVTSILNRSDFLPGDYMFSEQAPPEFIAGTLSAGGRPGWWLANGATMVAADDPHLYEILASSTTLPDYRGRVMVGPSGTTFTARGTLVGAVSDNINITLSGNTGAEAAHTHGPGGYQVVLPAGALNPTAAAPGPPVAGTYSVTGTSGAGSSHLHSLSGSFGDVATTIQPTRCCGAVWIKR
jgi:hypothetical protein